MPRRFAKRRRGVSVRRGKKRSGPRSAIRSAKTKRRTRLTARTFKGRRSLARRPRRGGQRNSRPAWFNTLARGITPDKALQEYGAQFTSAIGKMSWYTMFLNLSPLEIQSCMFPGGTGNASTAANLNQRKYYLSGLKRVHTFRNNANAQAVLQFYKLTPRRDLPDSGVTQIAPIATNVYATGGFRANPDMINFGFINYDASAGLSGTGTRIAYDSTSATPYMCGPVTENFKIMPMKARHHEAKKKMYKVVLQPGESCEITSYFNGPFMCSYAKFGMLSDVANQIQQTYECLRVTPLLLLQVTGNVAHDVSARTTINNANTYLDYRSKINWERWLFNSITTSTYNFTASAPTFVGAAEESNIATGARQTDL